MSMSWKASFSASSSANTEKIFASSSQPCFGMCNSLSTSDGGRWMRIRVESLLPGLTTKSRETGPNDATIEKDLDGRLTDQQTFLS